jgi:6-phosphogluconolactonase (cycloisomerase 2 family)
MCGSLRIGYSHLVRFVPLVFAILVLLPIRAHAVVDFVESYVDGQGGVVDLAMPTDVAVSPDGKHVYAVSNADDAIVRFGRNLTSGALTFVQAIVDGTGGVTGIAAANAVAVSPDGASVYVASAGGTVAVFARNATSGALTFVETEVNGQGGVSGLAGARDVVVSPDGAHVYAVGSAPGAVVTFARNPSTGALAFVEKDEDGAGGVDGIGGAAALVVSPDGAHVYVTGDADDAVAVFARDAGTGALDFVEAERDGVGGVDGIDGPLALAVSGDGKHVYVGGSSDDGLAVFARDAGTGALAFLQALHEGAGGVDGINAPAAVAVTPDGAHVVVAASAESEVGVFARNASTGLLTFVESVGGTGLGGIDAVRLAPGGKHLYTTARSSGSVSLFDVETIPPTTTSSTTSTTTSTGIVGTTFVPPTTGASTTSSPQTTSSSSTAPGATSSSTSSSTAATPTTTNGSTSTSPIPSTTTTLPTETCASRPSTFEVIECRLLALRAATGTTEALGTLRRKLGDSIDRAADRVGAAQGICSFGKAKPARARLAKARRQLARYVRRLRSKAAQRSVPNAVRSMLVAEAAAIQADVIALRRRVACPIDA